MIKCRAPYRVSFFGGGTDYPPWYLKHGGSVLSSSINKYCYISLRRLPPFFEHRLRIVYSKIEHCQNFEEIIHPSVRETLRFMGIDDGVEIHHDGDLPARSGMGSSSSFTVALLHACHAFYGQMASKKQLAMESIHIEQNMIKETVGSQDQVASAYGGLNRIRFKQNGEIEVNPLILSVQRSEELDSRLMLFFTGINRTASDIADSFVNSINEKETLLVEMEGMVQRGIEILQSDEDLDAFGELLHEAWVAKRGLSAEISNNTVDELYQRARKLGALGGKILGAGGGGFMLLFVDPELQEKVREELSELLYIPFRFEFTGSQVIVYEPHLESNYIEVEKDRCDRKIKSFQELNSL